MSKILVVDDDNGILGALRMILEEYNYLVKTISQESEVYPAIKSFSPDLIILDILLSGSDGRNICKKLKNDNLTKKIPIILSSAHSKIDDEFDRCKANDILPKPFDIETLISKVEKLTRSKIIN